METGWRGKRRNITHPREAEEQAWGLILQMPVSVFPGVWLYLLPSAGIGYACVVPTNFPLLFYLVLGAFLALCLNNSQDLTENTIPLAQIGIPQPEGRKWREHRKVPSAYSPASKLYHTSRSCASLICSTITWSTALRRY